MNRALFYCFLVLMVQCSSSEEEFSSVFDLDTSSDVIEGSVTGSTLSYIYQGQKNTLEWFTCQRPGFRGKPVFVVLADSDQPFQKASFCQDGMVQGLLAQGYVVAGMNLPGAQQSSGNDDWGGAQSLVAVSAFEKSLGLFYKKSFTLHGIGARGRASIAAAAYSKKKSLGLLILGSGVFDLEAVAKQSTQKTDGTQIAELVSKEGEVALEKRSIGWDPSGVAQKVLIYHGAEDQRFPLQSAKAFRDSSATQGVKVYLVILPKQGHKVPLGMERSAIDHLFERLQGE